jgi:ribosomal protein S18 acetylase RimI-like enzyme
MISASCRVWRERLAALDSQPFVLVANDDARIVGFICVLAEGDEAWGACIDNLHVAHDWQGRGVGRDLLRHAADWLCRTQSGAGVYLWVMEHNTRARAFYDRLGARHVETVELPDPGGGRAPNCRYVWADPRSLL